MPKRYETPWAREYRLKKMKEQYRLKMDNETEEERNLRRKRTRERAKVRYVNEMHKQKLARIQRLKKTSDEWRMKLGFKQDQSKLFNNIKPSTSAHDNGHSENSDEELKILKKFKDDFESHNPDSNLKDIIKAHPDETVEDQEFRLAMIREFYKSDETGLNLADVREARRTSKSFLTPQQREKNRQKYLNRIQNETEEEKLARKVHEREAKKRRRANLTPEKLEQVRKKDRERSEKRKRKKYQKSLECGESEYNLTEVNLNFSSDDDSMSSSMSNEDFDEFSSFSSESTQPNSELTQFVIKQEVEVNEVHSSALTIDQPVKTNDTPPIKLNTIKIPKSAKFIKIDPSTLKVFTSNSSSSAVKNIENDSSHIKEETEIEINDFGSASQEISKKPQEVQNDSLMLNNSNSKKFITINPKDMNLKNLSTNIGIHYPNSIKNLESLPSKAMNVPQKPSLSSTQELFATEPLINTRKRKIFTAGRIVGNSLKLVPKLIDETEEELPKNKLMHIRINQDAINFVLSKDSKKKKVYKIVKTTAASPRIYEFPKIPKVNLIKGSKLVDDDVIVVENQEIAENRQNLFEVENIKQEPELDIPFETEIASESERNELIKFEPINEANTLENNSDNLSIIKQEPEDVEQSTSMTINHPHKCSICHQSFPYKSSLVVHTFMHKKEAEHQLQIKQTAVKEINHEKLEDINESSMSVPGKQANIIEYKCFLCHFKSPFLNDLRVHRWKEHAQGPNPFVQHPDKPEKQLELLENETKRMRRVVNLQCLTCKRRFRDANNLKSHLREVHKAKLNEKTGKLEFLK